MIMFVGTALLSAPPLNRVQSGVGPLASSSDVLIGVEPSCVNPSKTIDGWIDGAHAVADAFERLARPLSARLHFLAQEKPSVMREPFDVVNDKGRLRVTDTDLSQEDRSWIEAELNDSGSLGALADAFSQQVVRTYETEHGTRDEDGVLLARTGFGKGSSGIDYVDLAASVDSSVKLRSLLRDVETAELPHWMPERMRYSQGGRLVQKYIEGDITTYVMRPDGTGEVSHHRGTMLRDDLWA